MRRHRPGRPRRTPRRRNYNLRGRLSDRRKHVLLLVIIVIVAYVLWRYPDLYQRLITTGPPAPSFPR